MFNGNGVLARNIRPTGKNFVGTNTLAYFTPPSVTKSLRYYYLFSMAVRQNKLECFIPDDTYSYRAITLIKMPQNIVTFSIMTLRIQLNKMTFGIM